jgi:uncharacterized protein YecE (DUF72 family)
MVGVEVRVGCCGFSVRREQYFRDFDLVEVQRTFYKLPQLQTVEKWRKEAPSKFEFVVKAWQLITHPATSPTYRKAGLNVGGRKGSSYGYFQPTNEVREAWEGVKRIALSLKSRVVLFQTPASFKPTCQNISHLKRFFKSVLNEPFIFVWEPRGEWEAGLVKSLCEELSLVHGVDPFQSKPLAGEIRYFRLHGGAGYRHRYSTKELKKLVSFCDRPLNYVLFNNLSMYQDALRFKKVLGMAQKNKSGMKL